MNFINGLKVNVTLSSCFGCIFASPHFLWDESQNMIITCRMTGLRMSEYHITDRDCPFYIKNWIANESK